MAPAHLQSDAPLATLPFPELHSRRATTDELFRLLESLPDRDRLYKLIAERPVVPELKGMLSTTTSTTLTVTLHEDTRRCAIGACVGRVGY